MAAPKFTPPKPGEGYSRAQAMLGRYQAQFDQRWAEAQKAIDEQSKLQLDAWEAEVAAAKAKLTQAQRDAYTKQQAKEAAEKGYLAIYGQAPEETLAIGEKATGSSSGSTSTTVKEQEAKPLKEGRDPLSGLTQDQKDEIADAHPETGPALLATGRRDRALQQAQNEIALGQATVEAQVKRAEDLAKSAYASGNDAWGDLIADEAARIQTSATPLTSTTSTRSYKSAEVSPETAAEAKKQSQESRDLAEREKARLTKEYEDAQKLAVAAADEYARLAGEIPTLGDRIDRSRMEYGAKFGSLRTPPQVVQPVLSRAAQRMGIKAPPPKPTMWDHLEELLPDEKKSTTPDRPANLIPEAQYTRPGADRPMAPNKYAGPRGFRPAGIEGTVGYSDTPRVKSPAPQDEMPDPDKVKDPFEDYLLKDWNNEPAPTTPPADMSGKIGAARSRALAQLEAARKRKAVI